MMEGIVIDMLAIAIETVAMDHWGNCCYVELGCSDRR